MDKELDSLKQMDLHQAFGNVENEEYE